MDTASMNSLRRSRSFRKGRILSILARLVEIEHLPLEDIKTPRVETLRKDG